VRGQELRQLGAHAADLEPARAAEEVLVPGIRELEPAKPALTLQQAGQLALPGQHAGGLVCARRDHEHQLVLVGTLLGGREDLA